MCILSSEFLSHSLCVPNDTGSNECLSLHCVFYEVGKIIKCYSHLFLASKFLPTPIALAARSKAWVCVRSLVGIAGSNPAEGMDGHVSFGPRLITRK
jgi:hypothetical protein